MTDLKPCPFCGKSDEIRIKSRPFLRRRLWAIYCHTTMCWLYFDPIYAFSRERIIEKWNKRHDKVIEKRIKAITRKDAWRNEE